MKRCFLVFLVILGSHFSYAQWTLQQCVGTAIERNIGLKKNSLGLEQTKLNQEQALGSFLPNLNGQVSHGYNWGQRIDPFTNQFATQRIQSNSLGLSTSVTLFSGLQNVNQYKKAEVDTRAQLLTFDYQRNQLALQVSVAYLNVLLTKELQASTELTVNRTKQQVKRITDLVNAGNAAEGSLRDVEAQLFSDEASYISAGNNVQSAILDIAQMMQLTEHCEGWNVASPEHELFIWIRIFRCLESVNRFSRFFILSNRTSLRLESICLLSSSSDIHCRRLRNKALRESVER